MRSFKKVAAVALSAVMTLAMGVSAFADQTIVVIGIHAELGFIRVSHSQQT